MPFYPEWVIKLNEPDESDIGRFFDALMPHGLPKGQYVLIWTLPDKTSYWHSNLGDALVECAKQSDAHADVYVGVGLTNKNLGKKSRTNLTNTSGMYATWIDLDYADAVHEKKNLPTKQEAEQFISEFDKKPTMVVHSGHGFQCWWAFQEPFIFQSEEQRKWAQAIARDFTYLVRDEAKAKGWALDSTFDLSRVMRVPGTWNRKDPKNLVPVTIVEVNPDARYYVNDFSTRTQAQVVEESSKPQEFANFTLNPNAEPPDKWKALSVNDSRAMDSWNRNRPDFIDQSPSSYDMSLATIAVLAEWLDQEIVDLLIASRRFHGDDLKLREDYYQRTIQRARSTTASQIVQIDDSSSGDDIKGGLSRAFGINIHKLVKFMGDPPTYTIHVSQNGEAPTSITLGDIDTITSPVKFRNKIAASIEKMIPRYKADTWDKYSQLLLNILEKEDLGEESSPSMSVTSLVAMYVKSRGISEDFDAAIEAGKPAIKEGILYISLRNFCYYIRMAEGERVTNREVARSLRTAGWERVTVNVEGADGERTTRSVWCGSLRKGHRPTPVESEAVI